MTKQKKRYQDDVIDEFIQKEGLKPESGMKVLSKHDKSLYINAENFLEKFCIFLKQKSYLK